MKFPHAFGVVDLGIVAVLIVFAVLPPREQFATAATKGDGFALAAAEARVIAKPDDGAAVGDLGRKLGDAGFRDWAIEETSHAATAMAPTSPGKWRALLAASIAYVDRLDVRPGLEMANLALTACKANQTACPSWEEVRMQLYQQHLDAGVQSGIDPHKDPKGFRKAGEAALRPIHIGNTPSDRAP